MRPHRLRDAGIGMAAVPHHPVFAIAIGDENFARPLHMGLELCLVTCLERRSLAAVVRTVRPPLEVDPPLTAALDNDVKRRRQLSVRRNPNSRTLS